MRYEREIEELFDTLTDYRCESHEDIANLTGWPMWKVGDVLGTVRTPSIAQEYGWTVPHVPRGRGEHLFQVVAIGEPITDPDLANHLRRGAISTMSLVVTEMQNQAHALTLAAVGQRSEVARQMRNAARAQDGAAAMVEIVLDTMSNGAP